MNVDHMRQLDTVRCFLSPLWQPHPWARLQLFSAFLYAAIATILGRIGRWWSTSHGQPGAALRHDLRQITVRNEPVAVFLRAFETML